MLIVATAILATVLPLLRRSSQGARPSEPRVSEGSAPSEHSDRPVLMAENVAERQAPERPAPPGGADELQQRGLPGRERFVPGRWGGPSRWGGDQRALLARWARERLARERQARERWARERQDRRQPRGGELYDDYEVEQMVREQLYGSRGRRR